ncbi:unnamed protein product [Closterium sp. NIES-54]
MPSSSRQEPSPTSGQAPRSRPLPLRRRPRARHPSSRVTVTSPRASNGATASAKDGSSSPVSAALAPLTPITPLAPLAALAPAAAAGSAVAAAPAEVSSDVVE